jgi:hypothetical protein
VVTRLNQGMRPQDANRILAIGRHADGIRVRMVLVQRGNCDESEMYMMTRLGSPTLSGAIAVAKANDKKVRVTTPWAAVVAVGLVEDQDREEG